MKKELIKGISDIVLDMVKGSTGRTPAKDRNTENPTRGIADSVVDTVSGMLGDGIQGKGQGKGGGQGGGRRSGGGCSRV